MKKIFLVFICLLNLAFAQNQSANQAITITVNAGIGITSTRLTSGVEGSGYTATLAASGGVAPYTWSATGLPSGLSIAASTGIVSGTIVDNGCTANTPQSTSVVITAQDSSGSSASATLPMNLVCRLIIVQPTATQLIATAGANYSLQLTTTGGNGAISWAVTTGTLPVGLSLNPQTGLINGKPTTAGSVSFTVTAIDQTSQVAQWHVNLQWGASTTAGVTYNLYRANQGSFSKITNVSGLNFIDNAPVRGTSLQYEVTALNSSGESVPSNVITIAIP